jgi:hypothetical protein
VETFNTYTKIIELLKQVKNRRQKAQKSANKLKTLNNVKQNNLNALALQRDARAIEKRVSSKMEFPSTFATYPNMVQWLLDQRAKELKERENKIKNLENYKQRERSKLNTNDERRIFNLIIGNTKPRNASINEKWYSNYKNGYEGSRGYQVEPLRGKELINYKIKVAKRLHANSKEPKKNETSREIFNRLFPGMPSYY